MIYSRFFVCLLSLALIVCQLPFPTAIAQEERETQRDIKIRKLTPKTRLSLQRGLEFLASRQHDDGSFGSGSRFRRNVAVTALSGMAFLSAGHTPGRGKYGKNVQKAVNFILSRCQPNGYIIDEPSKSHGPMYGHGFATLFLTQVYGMASNKDLRDKLAKAVTLIVNSQTDDGGWRYYPEPIDEDVSVTVCQVMALRAARNCGIFVPKETVDRCMEYIKKCQNPDGGFRYQLTRTAVSEFPRSAAGTVALYSGGIYQGEAVEKSLVYLLRHIPQNQRFGFQQHYFYGHYYGVQAMWHAGGKYWDQWYPAIERELINRQMPTGGWSSTQICVEYGTAMACLVLQMPENSLPIFQR